MTALLVVCISSGGCDAMAAPFLAHESHINGRWQGRVVAVEVRDYSGKLAYPAAALELTGGTGFKQMRGANPPEIGGGETPLLAAPAKNLMAVIIDPSRLPIGQEVEVRGSMYLSHIYKQPDAPPDESVVVSRSAAQQGRARNEHFILLDGQPSIVRK